MQVVAQRTLTTLFCEMNVPRGWECLNQNPSVAGGGGGGIDISWNHTIVKMLTNHTTNNNSNNDVLEVSGFLLSTIIALLKRPQINQY